MDGMPEIFLKITLRFSNFKKQIDFGIQSHYSHKYKTVDIFCICQQFILVLNFYFEQFNYNWTPITSSFLGYNGTKRKWTKMKRPSNKGGMSEIFLKITLRFSNFKKQISFDMKVYL